MQAKPSGKLEYIKSITESLPSVNALLSKCRDARMRLDSALSDLKTVSREVVSTREEAVRRAEKEAQFADLIKQREEERRTAEAIVDQRAEELKRIKAEQAAKPKVESKPVPKTNQEQSRSFKPPVKENTFKSPPQQSFSPRPPFQPRQFNNQNQNIKRTWTPSQSTGGYGRGIAGNTRPPFDPNRPRPQGGYGPRPGFTPRPQGAVGQRPLGNVKPTEKFTPKVNTHDTRKKTKEHSGEKQGMDRRSLLRRGIIEEQDIEERMLTRIFRTKKSKENSKTDVKIDNSTVKITTTNLTVKTMSEKIGKSATDIIKQLMVLGEMCTINSTISFEMAELVAAEFGIMLELHADKTSEEKMRDLHKETEDQNELAPRPPVVTVLGHVDHGKTSLLDAIRNARVTAGEAGGITQHIGAYQVNVKSKKITFIDTPGHAAFEKMRARGAKVTDIAILLVAADDGVMPQTVEAIKHIQKHNLPMVVAINKIDKKEADIERVKAQLGEHNVVPEDWGGSAIIVPVSATEGTGLDKLLEMILLVADMNAYKANPDKEASGTIIESRLDKTRGAVVTVLVQSGTLKIGDTLLAGTTYGKVRAMTDENGKEIRRAKPSTPVQVLGFHGVPKAGDSAYVVDDKLTKEVVAERKDKEKVRKTTRLSTTDAENAFDVMTQREKIPLNVIVKGDVAGSVEAIIQTLATITSDEVVVNVISSGVGAVNDNDVALAEMADALLIAFQTKTIAVKKKGVKIHEFRVIYEIFDFVTTEMVKRFKPKFQDVYHGKASVRAVFKSSAIGLIAGCMVTDGKIVAGGKIKLVRGDEVLGEYKMDSLKIKTNNVKEVSQNHECGIKLESGVIPIIGDVLECYGTEQLPIVFNGRKYEF